ncbi:MAG: DUF3536 domain-containing protein [Saprospiraceae bacterium]
MRSICKETCQAGADRPRGHQIPPTDGNAAPCQLCSCTPAAQRFFNEISGIETDQVLQYALRAMQYARYVKGPDFQKEFEKRLENAPSNINQNGEVSYRNNVIPAQSNMSKVGMRFAASSPLQ